MTKVYVKNDTGKDVTEIKPGVGSFTIKAGKELEITDKVESTTLPNGQKHTFVRHTAKEIAESIINDSGGFGLSIIEK